MAAALADMGLDDSDDDVGAPTPAEDSEEPPAGAAPTKMQELFGDDDDDDEPAEQGGGEVEPTPSDAARPAVSRPAAALDTSALPAKDVRVAHRPRPPASAMLCITKLPGMLRMATAPFDSATYDPREEEEGLDETELLATHALRWRVKRGSDGAPERTTSGALARETNARLIRWSDGSMQVRGRRARATRLVVRSDRPFRAPRVVSSSSVRSRSTWSRPTSRTTSSFCNKSPSRATRVSSRTVSDSARKRAVPHY